MLLQKRISAVFFAVIIFIMTSVTVCADETPNSSGEGSISVAMTYNGAAVSGGTLTLYRVGELCENDGNYSFVLTEEFAESGVSSENLEDSASAAVLSAYASENSASSVASTDIGSDGTAVFSELEQGLYLIVQNQAADGYEAVAPFLVSIPMNENGTYVYAVDASPKVELKKVSETATSEPAVQYAGTTLPQTGQLNWPIPLLAVLGLCLCLLGWALRSDKREKNNAA